MALQIKNLFSQICRNILNIFKSKRFFVIILLFFVISGTVFPAKTYALSDWACWAIGAMPFGSTASFACQTYKATSVVMTGTGDGLDPVGKAVLNAIIRAVGAIPIAITNGLSSMASKLFNESLNDANFKSYTGFDNPAISVGWPIIRNLAYMFIVLGFVVIGLATILRFKNYEAQKLLAPLIIAAILINFSLTLCAIPIDASNILITYLNRSGNSLDITWTESITKQLEGLKLSEFNISDDSSWFDGLAQVTGILIQNWVAIFVYITFALLFIARRIALWILVILSPIAFVAAVFPISQQFYRKWRDNFIQWCIIGSAGSFFIYIGNQIAPGISATVGEGSSLVFFVPSIFLIIGFFASLQTSAMGANMITSRAKGAFSKANAYLNKGAKATGKYAGGKLANISGATGLYNRAKDRVTQGLENRGLLAPGITAKNRRARLSADQRSARLAQLSDAEKAALWQENRAGEEAALDRAAITKEFAGKNKLSLLGNQANQDRAIDESLEHGVRFNEIVGGMNSTQIADIINGNQRDPESRAEGFKTLMKRGQLDLIQANYVNDPLLTPAQNQAAARTATQALRTNAVTEAMTHGLRPEEAERADYHYGANNEARLRRIATANPGLTPDQVIEAATQQALDETITSMSHEQLRNIDADHLEGERGARRVDRLTPDKINAFQLAAQPLRRAVKQHFNPADPDHRLLTDLNTAETEYLDAVARGDQAAAANRYTEWRRLRSLYMAQNTFSGL